MAKVTISRRNDYERADGKAALYAYICIRRNKVRIPLEIAVSAEEWDPVSETIKGRSKEVKDKNLIISNVKAKITDILVRCRLTGESLTRDKFLMLYHTQARNLNFIEFAEKHVYDLRTVLQPQTREHHLSVLKKLRAYNPNLTFEDITVDWLRVYAAHLRDAYGNNPNTIGKNMSVIRMHFMSALRDGKVKDNPFEFYKIPSGETKVVYLTEVELERLIALYKKDSLPDSEQDVLRFFLFMTFTGMHISDARNLLIENIIKNEIHYRRIKTGTLVQVPLSAPAQMLVEYYQQGRTRGRLFLKLPTDQAVNRLIKITCRRVDIIKAVSAKAARHTFATLYYKLNNGDIGTLSRLLGHTSVNTTMIYAHIMKDSRVAGVAAFNNLM